jgi:hypothetical protein
MRRRGHEGTDSLGDVMRLDVYGFYSVHASDKPRRDPENREESFVMSPDCWYGDAEYPCDE